MWVTWPIDDWLRKVSSWNMCSVVYERLICSLIGGLVIRQSCFVSAWVWGALAERAFQLVKYLKLNYYYMHWGEFKTFLPWCQNVYFFFEYWLFTYFYNVDWQQQVVQRNEQRNMADIEARPDKKITVYTVAGELMNIWHSIDQPNPLQ